MLKLTAVSDGSFDLKYKKKTLNRQLKFTCIMYIFQNNAMV